MAADPIEFESWKAFYRLFPFDDRSRYFRPAALVASSMGGADVPELLDWLDKKPSRYAGYSAVDRSLMERFGFTPPPRKD